MAQLSKSTTKAAEMARLHLRTGNPGAYARVMSAEHRCASARQQAAIEDAIEQDRAGQYFTMVNGCLLAGREFA